MSPIYIVKAKKTFLKSPLSTTANQLIIDELVDSQGNDIAMASFGAWGVIVLTQGNTVEMIKFDGLSRDADGVVTLDVATNGRDIAPITPYTGSSTGQRFNATADAIITNDPLTMMMFGLVTNANTWDLLQTFSVVPRTTGGNAVTANELVRKAQLDSALLGVVTSVSTIIEGVAGETISAGNLIYFDDVTNTWLKCDADTASTVDDVIIGIAQGAGTLNNSISNGIMLRGVDANQSGMTSGVVMYASNTAGAISSSAGTTSVAVGMSKSATELYFDPRFNTTLTKKMFDAMAGTSGTPLSSSNKVVDNADTTGTGSVLRASSLSTLYNMVFGDGGDGDATIASGTTSITKDMYYNNLTIQTGGTLDTAGYRVFVKGTLTFQGTGKIARNGNNGSNGNNGGNGSAGAGGAGGAGGNGGSALASGTLYGGEAGGNGATGGGGTTGGGSNGTNGNQASTPSGITNAVGSSANAGTGNGGNSGGGFNGNTGGTGGTAGTGNASVTNPKIMPRTVNNIISLHTLIDNVSAFMKGSAGAVGGSGGAGGAGGNQGAGSYAGGGGGGGGGAGGTGGIVMVCAYTVVGGYADCIQAKGGTGGNGGNGGNPTTQFSGGGGSGGGGNGGTGGVVGFIYHSYTGTALDTTCVAGGAGGTKGATAGIAGTGGGSAGSLGGDGATGATGKLYSIAI